MDIGPRRRNHGVGVGTAISINTYIEEVQTMQDEQDIQRITTADQPLLTAFPAEKANPFPFNHTDYRLAGNEVVIHDQRSLILTESI